MPLRRTPTSHTLRLAISLDRASEGFFWTLSVDRSKNHVPHVQVFEQGRLLVPTQIEDSAPLQVVLLEAASMASLRL